MNSKIYIYTSNYPYTKTSEAFLTPEIGYAKEYFSEVTIIPFNGDSFKRDVPQNVSVDVTLVQRSVWASIRAFLGLFSFRVLKSDGSEYPKSFSYIKDALKYYYGANLVYNDLKDRLRKEETPVVLYSYWLIYVPIAFAWIKQKYSKKKIFAISRAHGSDIYSTEVGVYFPKRNLVMNNLNEIFTVSSYGRDYLINRYAGLTPIKVSRLGVKDNYMYKTKDGNQINMVSCSNLIPLKRVALLYLSLNNYAESHPEKKVSWIHIGDGPLLQELKNSSLSHNYNLSVEFTGALNNKEILELYRKQYFDCYILLSESEGVPVSIIEAISSGIPVVATNVGGVSEIVNEETGFLLRKEFAQEEFDQALDKLLESNTLRESAHTFFKKYYEAETNFRNFYKSISQTV